MSVRWRCDLVSLVYLTDDATDPLCRDLRDAGHLVVPASNVHEALWLGIQNRASVVLIRAGFTDPQISELKERYKTVRLRFDTRSEDVLGQLAKAS
jgi:hypothetical protein